MPRYGRTRGAKLRSFCLSGESNELRIVPQQHGDGLTSSVNDADENMSEISPVCSTLSYIQVGHGV